MMDSQEGKPAVASSSSTDAAAASTGNESLTFEELSVLNERKAVLKQEHEDYISTHPELKSLLSSFMSSVLMEKPEDVISFAQDHFAAYRPNGGPMPLVVAGPSGVGKGTLINMILQKYPDSFGFSVSHTTRKPREGEEDGVAYHFSSQDDVQMMIDQELFLEHAAVHGNVYGTSTKAVKAVQAKDKICVLDIDIQGVRQVKASKLKCNYIFVTPPSMMDLEDRLRGRGTESEEKILLRIENAKEEIEFSKKSGAFDFILVNKSLDSAYNQLEEQLKKWYPEQLPE